MIAVPGYHVETVLGRGRCSVVYLATERRCGRKLALKVARRTQLERMIQAKDFAPEFAAQSALAHRHVLQVYGHGVHAEEAFLAMEIAERGPLALQRGPVAPAKAFALVVQAASALAMLHREGWVHRDVKPANLLQRSDGSLALGDFGSARRHGEGASQPGAVVGTPQYAAPEQSQGAAAQPVADVYSLGIVLYEMLMGQVPYPGETLTELFCQHQLASVPRLPAAQGIWQPLLDAMLAKEPHARPRDGATVFHELQRLQKGLS